MPLDTLNAIKTAYTAQRDGLIAAKAHRDALEKQLQDKNQEILDLENDSQSKAFVNEILAKVAEDSRAQAKLMIEKVVCYGLQFATQNPDNKFVIEELGTRAKPSYEFYIETVTNGVPSKKLIESSGGGFIDICSNIVKYMYYQVFKDPQIMNSTIMLDEPGKMMSEDIMLKFAEYIKFLGQQFDQQFIMITHNPNLSVIADKPFQVSNSDGISMVSEIQAADLIMASVNEEVEKGFTDEHNNQES